MMYHPKLAEVVRRDPRYAYEAYEFVFDALTHCQKLLGRLPPQPPTPEAEPNHHVTGPELLEGVRDLALREFGLMARTVLRLWGINCTGDVGEIVFNLVEANLMSKTDRDCRADFHDLFNLDQALVQEYQLHLDEAE
jgi:uncharacterized repeat protein (TIGR04138 family)